MLHVAGRRAQSARPERSPRRRSPMPPGTRRRSCSAATRTFGRRSATASAASRYSCSSPSPQRSHEKRRPMPRLRRSAAHAVSRRRSSRRGRRPGRPDPPDRPAARRHREPRAATRPWWPRRGPRPAWPGGAGSRNPRSAKGRPGRAHRAADAASSGGSTHPVRTMRAPPGDAYSATRNSPSPQPSGPARTRATSGCRSATGARRAQDPEGPCAVPPSRWRGSSAWRPRESGAGAALPPRPRALRGDRALPVQRYGRGRGRPRTPPPPRLRRTPNRCAPRRPAARARRIKPG